MSRKFVPGCARIRRANNGQFYALIQATGNRKTLSKTEEVETKDSIINNINSQARVFGGRRPLIIDET